MRAISLLPHPLYLHCSHTSGNVTCAGWQVTLCDLMWHGSSRSGEATLRTAILLLLTYLLTYLLCEAGSMHLSGVRPSVCLSVCSSVRLSVQQTHCCGFAAVGPAGRIYRSCFLAQERFACGWRVGWTDQSRIRATLLSQMISRKCKSRSPITRYTRVLPQELSVDVLHERKQRTIVTISAETAKKFGEYRHVFTIFIH